MKKLLMAVCLFVLGTGFLYAQPPQGGRGGGGEMMKQRLKDELKFSDAKIDSVMAIQMDFQAKNRELRTDQSMSDADKKTKTEAATAARQARLKTVLNDEEIKKLDAYYEEMRKNRPNRNN